VSDVITFFRLLHLKLSFIFFIPAFSLRIAAAVPSVRELEISHRFQQSKVVLLASLSHQDGPSKAGDVVTPRGPWST